MKILRYFKFRYGINPLASVGLWGRPPTRPLDPAQGLLGDFRPSPGYPDNGPLRF